MTTKVLKFKDGSRYEGEVFKKAPNGNGRYYDKYNKLIYDGHWVNGLPNGRGKYINADDDVYVGSFFQGLYNGHGILTNSLGQVLQDKQFELELPEENLRERFKSFVGDEKLTKEKEFTYKLRISNSNFKTPKRDMSRIGFEATAWFYGEKRNPKLKGLNALNGFHNSFVSLANFAQNKYEGHGVITYDHGLVLEGNLSKNLAHGFTNAYYVNGDVYKGQWREGIKHGEGEYYSHGEQKTYIGTWKNDKRSGNFQIVLPDGTLANTFFHKDVEVNPKILDSKNTNLKPYFNEPKPSNTKENNNPNLFFKFSDTKQGEITKFASSKEDDIVFYSLYEGTKEGWGSLFTREYTMQGEGNFGVLKEDSGAFYKLFNGYTQLYHCPKGKDGAYAIFGNCKKSKFSGYAVFREGPSVVYEGDIKHNVRQGYGINYQIIDNETVEYTAGLWENNKLIKPVTVNIPIGHISNLFKTEQFIFTLKDNSDFPASDFKKNKQYLTALENSFSTIRKRIITQTEKTPHTTAPNANTSTNSNASNPGDLTQKDLNKLLDEKFKGFIGIEAVKKELKKIISLKRLKGDNFTLSDMHMAFSGAPGTGKTSVARIFADVLYEGGILPTNKLVEVNFSTLYGPYVGHSLKELNQKIEEAVGGILFLDEAHQISTKGSDNSSFQKELINGLVTSLENKRSDLIVIFAGYGQEMEEWIKTSDRGLSSRISRVINFKDFTTEELLQLYQNMLAEEKNNANQAFSIHPSAKPQVNKLIAKLRQEKDDNFGNARDIRILVRKTLEGFAELEDSLTRTVITAEDLEKIFAINPHKTNFNNPFGKIGDNNREL